MELVGGDYACWLQQSLKQPIALRKPGPSADRARDRDQAQSLDFKTRQGRRLVYISTWKRSAPPLVAKPQATLAKVGQAKGGCNLVVQHAPWFSELGLTVWPPRLRETSP